MKTVTALEKITKARAHLIMDARYVFYGLLAMRLTIIEDAKKETLATDGKHLFYNSDFVNTLSQEEMTGVLAHEITHISLGHIWRKGNREHQKWNIAADYVTNHTVLQSGLKLPKDCLVDSRYNTLAVEEVYARLQDQEQQQNQQQQAGNTSQQQQGGGSGPQQDQDQSQDPDQDANQDPMDTNPSEQNSEDKSSQTGSQPGQEDNEENQTETEQPTKKEDTDPGRCGAMIDPASEEEMREIKAEWKAAMSQAVQMAKGLDAGLRRMVEEVLNPPLPWTAILRDFVEYTARNDYNWNRPSRRYAGTGVILPSLISEELPEVVIAVDTSGSISQRDLAEFSKEVSGVLQAYETTIRVLYCDTVVQKEQVFTKADLPLKLEAVGGGGTDFRPVFNHVAKINTPSCLVYFTDLYGDFPRCEPEYPVLWVTKTKTRKAPFGKTVVFE